jgi:hypothetical protein
MCELYRAYIIAMTVSTALVRARRCDVFALRHEAGDGVRSITRTFTKIVKTPEKRLKKSHFIKIEVRAAHYHRQCEGVGRLAEGDEPEKLASGCDGSEMLKGIWQCSSLNLRSIT